MPTQSVQVTGVKILMWLPIPLNVFATDDPTDDEKYATPNNPSLELFQEICAKMVAYQKNQTPIKLQIENGHLIVSDASVSRAAAGIGNVDAERPNPLRDARRIRDAAETDEKRIAPSDANRNKKGEGKEKGKGGERKKNGQRKKKNGDTKKE
jgi:hypothetical protein